MNSGPVATTTHVLPSDAGAVKSWYSTSGRIQVQERIGPTGVVTRIDRYAYSVADNRLVITHTVVFPALSDWATVTTSSECALTCYADNWLYLSPSLIHRGLANHELKIVGSPTTIDGRNVVEVMSAPQIPGAASAGGLIKAWMDPVNDEVIQFNDGIPGAQATYTWLPGTPANLAHLSLNIPASYRQVSGRYVSGPTPPPTNVTYQSLLVACATQSSNLAPPPESTVFTSVRSGTTDGTPWALWFAVQRGEIIFAMMSGTGGNALCIPGAGDSTNVAQPSDELGVGQLPGQPVAFVFGVVNDPAITRAEATVMGISANVMLSPLPAPLPSSRYAFAEIEGLSCKSLASTGFSYSDSVYKGSTYFGGSSSGSGNASSISACQT